MKLRLRKLVKINYFIAVNAELAAEDAVSMIVNGFCKEVFKELPMEFAVEAQKLMAVSLEKEVWG